MVVTVVRIASITYGVNSEAIAVITNSGEGGFTDAVFIFGAGSARVSVRHDCGGVWSIIVARHSTGFGDGDGGVGRTRFGFGDVL